MGVTFRVMMPSHQVAVLLNPTRVCEKKKGAKKQRHLYHLYQAIIIAGGARATHPSRSGTGVRKGEVPLCWIGTTRFEACVGSQVCVISLHLPEHSLLHQQSAAHLFETSGALSRFGLIFFMYLSTENVFDHDDIAKFSRRASARSVVGAAVCARLAAHSSLIDQR